MICASRSVPRVATTNAWVSPRVNRAEPWVRGNTPLRISIARTVRVSRPSIGGAAGLRTGLFVANLVCSFELGLGQAVDLRDQRLILGGGLPMPLGLAGV